jgi:hypothetical protein
MTLAILCTLCRHRHKVHNAEVRVEVYRGRLDLLVVEPEGDHGRVDLRLEETHRASEPEHVGSDAFARQARTGALRATDVDRDPVLDRVAAVAPVSGLPAPFVPSAAGDVRADVDVHVIAAEPDEFGDPQAALEGDEKQHPVPPPV